MYHISNNWYYKDKVFEKKNWSSFQKMTRSATAAASSETMCEICCVPVPGAVSILLNHFDQRFQWNYISVCLNFYVPEWNLESYWYNEEKNSCIAESHKELKKFLDSIDVVPHIIIFQLTSLKTILSFNF